MVLYYIIDRMRINRYSPETSRGHTHVTEWYISKAVDESVRTQLFDACIRQMSGHDCIIGRVLLVCIKKIQLCGQRTFDGKGKKRFPCLIHRFAGRLIGKHFGHGQSAGMEESDRYRFCEWTHTVRQEPFQKVEKTKSGWHKIYGTRGATAE